MVIRTVKLTELKPATYNPRAISDRAKKGLKNSIERFGLVEPIIWNEQTGNIVGGHQRYAVLKSQKVKETDVVVVDLPIDEEKALNLTLNNPAIAGQFTEDVHRILEDLQEIMPQMCIDMRLGDIADLDLSDLRAQFEKPGDEEPLARLDELGGKEVTCPECQHTFRIGAERGGT